MLRRVRMFAKPHKGSEHLERRLTVHMGGMVSSQQAMAAASIGSRIQQQWYCCRTASLAPPADSMQQAAASRPSACQASAHAPQMLVSGVRQQQHACTSTAAVVAHGASCVPAVHPRGQPSIPRPRGTSGAIAQQRVGLLLPDKDSNTLRDEGSMASAISASDASMRGSDARLRFLPEVTNPTPYGCGGLDLRATRGPLVRS